MGLTWAGVGWGGSPGQVGGTRGCVGLSWMLGVWDEDQGEFGGDMGLGLTPQRCPCQRGFPLPWLPKPCLPFGAGIS